MTNLPPTVPTPPRGSYVMPDGEPTSHFVQWLELILKRTGGPTGIPVIGDMATFETTVNQSDLASAASKTLLDAAAGEQWKVRGILLSGDGTDFSGGSGDRLLAVSDGTSTWTLIPAANLQSLAAARWGETALPYPATASHMMTTSAAGTDITAAYSGGSNDYTAGELTIALIVERTA